MSWLTSILYFTITSTILGMPSSVTRKQVRIPLRHANLDIKASSSPVHGIHSQNPKHSTLMRQLYQRLLIGNTTDLSTLDHSVLQDFDTILSLTAKSCSQLKKHLALSFDLSTITSNTEIQLAELTMPLSSPERIRDVTLDIYHSKEGKGKLFLGSIEIDFSSERRSTLKVINITRIMQYYFQQGKNSSHDEGKEDNKRSKNEEETDCTGISTHKVVLVVFTKENVTADFQGYTNLIQAAQSSKHVVTSLPGTMRHRKRRHARHAMIMDNFSTRVTENESNLCRKVDMMVDFEKFGWGQKIVYPKKFNAYRCEGACPIPLTAKFKPTNHAYIQSLVKFYSPDKVPCPSCVPLKIRPLSMLMYEGEKVVLKHHADMIAEECGCR